MQLLFYYMGRLKDVLKLFSLILKYMVFGTPRGFPPEIKF